VALIDVVMEAQDDGLRLVRHIRETLGNRKLRIILRTGQPGSAPERTVITDYEINDFRAKSEMTADRLLTSVLVALRSFRDLERIELTEAAEGRARAAFQARSAFLAQVSHELRTPLNAIINFAEMLHEDLDERGRADEIETLEYLQGA